MNMHEKLCLEGSIKIENGDWKNIERHIEYMTGDSIQSSNCSGYFNEKMCTTQFYTFVGIYDVYNVTIRPLEHRITDDGKHKWKLYIWIESGF